MAMQAVYFPVVSPGSITDSWDPTSALVGQRGEPGTTVVVKDPTTGEFSIARIVQLDNNGCTVGDLLVQNFATLKSFSVAKSSTTDLGGMIYGVAAATIGSQKCGYAYIGGYVEKANVSQTTASGEYLSISGSTAGNLTNDRSSAFNSGTQGNASAFQVVARARAAVATGVMSIQIIGIWG
jgi:hypothetical protein